ncbi:sigma-54-dependent Fis family transcriptional regulator [Pyxidicoccus fallax]|uniref:Sigma-54-dependent Fis family transcriptional regulator n=1 Tax=Pyxidicoccus fallax TaxID=394095 RepID=A0A848LD67_9BACT|nr:sigma-54 dependent transcriptional regulator [Pyxidicoccus fallax]NMO16364.1 sigma-54-dependent Fis family transcriptional regulator [Pyxidicoccus fallax]NPC78168.1 sigma-54-dependent Fis family transcriptional regulator [Pyxidicoccus fallax]
MARTLADVSTAAIRDRSGGPTGPRSVPALTVISHPLPRRVGERLLLDAVSAGREVALSRNGPDFTRPGSALGEPLSDPFISRKPLLLAPGTLPGHVRLTNSDGGTQVGIAGTLMQGTWELSSEELTAGVPLELGGRVVVLLHLAETGGEAPVADTLGMVGESTGVLRLRRHIERVADLDVPVLIRGETGTGKERVAQAIHQRSRRRDGKFISVNLGAIPKELAAAELFGTHKGAFTGATQSREGFFRAAHGGTLFLDEVGEAPPEVQVMLLRVLETGELYPVGGSTPVTVDVRLLAATDANLEEQIRDGRFKAPLMHRLAGYDIHVPPLRERREDLGRLFFHFAREELASIGEAHRLDNDDAYAEPWLPASLAVRLVRFSWPGNIRQLRNLARQLVIGSRGQPRLLADPRLEQELAAAAGKAPANAASAPSPGNTSASEGTAITSSPATGPASATVVASAVPASPAPLEAKAPRRKASQLTEQELLAALRENDWDLKATAEALGIARPSLYDLIDKSPHIRTAGDLSAEEITRCFHACAGDLDAMVRTLEVSRRALGRRLKELGLEPRNTPA